MPERSVIFDKQAFMERFGNDEDIVREIIEIAIIDVPNQIVRLKECIQKGDMKLIAQQAHTLKGTSSNINAQALTILALELENAAKEGNALAVAPLLSDLELQLTLLMDSLKEAFDKKE